MIISFGRHAISNSGLFKQIWFNISASNFTSWTEMNTDKFTLYNFLNEKYSYNFDLVNLNYIMYISLSGKKVTGLFWCWVTFYHFIFYKYICMYILTKRDELLLRVVLALPYASNTGLADTIWSSKLASFALKNTYNYSINVFKH